MKTDFNAKAQGAKTLGTEMNCETPKGKNVEDITIDFFVTPYKGSDGVPRTITLGLGRNRTLWVEWEELGLRPQDIRGLLKTYPGQVLLLDPESDRVFVNADAVTGIIESAAVREAWQHNLKFLLRNYEWIRGHDATGNN